MVRPPSVDSNGMKKGAWSEEEDNKLKAYVLRYGHWNWRLLPKYAGLARCGKSCRLRWVNYLKPGIKRGDFSKEEEELIIKLHAELGNKWSAIATKLPGRTDNEIKNFYHTRIEKHRMRNPATKKVKGHANSEASSKDDQEKALENTLCHQRNRDESSFSEASSLDELQESIPSLDANTSPQVDLWPDIFQAGTNCNQSDGFPPLIEEEFYCPELHYSELSSSDSSYMSALDWIADDDHSIITSECVDPSIQGSFWRESLASSISNYQNESLMLEVGGFYDLDYGVNLFS